MHLQSLGHINQRCQRGPYSRESTWPFRFHQFSISDPATGMPYEKLFISHTKHPIDLYATYRAYRLYVLFVTKHGGSKSNLAPPKTSNDWYLVTFWYFYMLTLLPRKLAFFLSQISSLGQMLRYRYLAKEPAHSFKHSLKLIRLTGTTLI